MFKSLRKVVSVIVFVIVGTAILVPYLLLELTAWFTAGLRDWINEEMTEWMESFAK